MAALSPQLRAGAGDGRAALAADVGGRHGGVKFGGSWWCDDEFSEAAPGPTYEVTKARTGRSLQSRPINETMIDGVV